MLAIFGQAWPLGLRMLLAGNNGEEFDAVSGATGRMPRRSGARSLFALAEMRGHASRPDFGHSLLPWRTAIAEREARGVLQLL